MNAQEARELLEALELVIEGAADCDTMRVGCQRDRDELEAALQRVERHRDEIRARPEAW